MAKKIIKALQHNYECDVSKVLLFVSNAASVMLKTGKLLKNYFPNMLHLTCFAHGLHRICEFIRDSFPDINSSISCVGCLIHWTVFLYTYIYLQQMYKR
jgi:hypothetical protein